MTMDSGCSVFMFHKKVEATTLSYPLLLENVMNISLWSFHFNEVIYLAKVS